MHRQRRHIPVSISEDYAAGGRDFYSVNIPGFSGKDCSFFRAYLESPAGTKREIIRRTAASCLSGIEPYAYLRDFLRPDHKPEGREFIKILWRNDLFGFS